MSAPRAPARGKSAKWVAVGLGRRKSSVARVRLCAGDGKVTVNGRALEAYFPSDRDRNSVRAPLVAVEVAGRYDAWVRAAGGGTTGQAEAARLGIARSLVSLQETHRPALRKAGFMTVDARIKERRKYGHKKARKSFQFSKR